MLRIKNLRRPMPVEVFGRRQGAKPISQADALTKN